MKSYIIAEAGVNHNGDIERAIKMVDVAKSSGADAIKFQTFKPKLICSDNCPKADYQQVNTNDTVESQINMLEKLKLKKEEYIRLFNYCKEVEIDFISTPFDNESANLLESIGVNIYKIGSGDLNNFPLLKCVASKNKDIILSTGMSTMDEVENSIRWIKQNGSQNITLLHCVSAYPTLNEDLNLLAITSMKKKFNIPVGFSDHTTGYKGAIIAISLGASTIEKHFTLDKNLPGPDHVASLDPEELQHYINEIRETEMILGNGIKICQKSEFNSWKTIRRSLAFSRDMKQGDIINEEDIITLRPNSGIPADQFESVINKHLLQEVTQYDFVAHNMLQS